LLVPICTIICGGCPSYAPNVQLEKGGNRYDKSSQLGKQSMDSIGKMVQNKITSKKAAESIERGDLKGRLFAPILTFTNDPV
jgi:hypothetical protein